jgi:hypothetical protein
MLKRGRKRGVSTVIEYVLVISVLLIIAVLVYLFLKSYVLTPTLKCSDEVSLLIKSYQCNSNKLTLNLRNNGNFKLEGYYIHATTSPNQEVATFDLSNYTDPGSWISPTGVKLGEIGAKNSFEITNEETDTFDLTESGPIYSVEIIPIRWQEKDKKNFLVSCTNAKSKRIIDCLGTCTPDCGTRVCGSVPNGCGTSCGNCGTGETCNSAGQCVSGCIDECIPGRRECVGNSYRTCVNDYDADLCYEWNSLTQCLPTETCSGGICIPPTGNIYYLAPLGNDFTGDGSITNPWFNITKAWTVLEAGDIVYMRGGTYYYNKQVLSDKSGSEDNLITISAYPEEIPVITKSSSYSSSSWPTALIYIENSNYLHVKGLEVTGFIPEDNDQWSGFYIYSSQNSIFEQIKSHDNGKGMTVHNIDDCRILNCDFYNNQDAYTNAWVPEGLEFYGDSDANPNAVNYVSGCRFWWNAGKGMSAYFYKGTIYISDSWAWYNGYLPGTFNTGVSSGMGFSLGGLATNDPGILARVVTNCIAFKNRGWGFSENDDAYNMQIYNNIAYNNGIAGGGGGGFDFNHAGVPYYIKNNIAYSNSGNDYSLNTLTNVNYNSWDSSPAVTVDNTDFVSLVYSQLSNPRNSDGSLPDITFLHLAQVSDLIDKGTNVNLPYLGSAPDLGPFESDY